MKQEELLEAIGGIDEGFLMEAEQGVPGKKGGSLMGKLGLVAAIVAALAVSVAASTGVFSRPVEDMGMVTDETVAPFDMDAQGNIILQGVKGLKITMEVELNKEIPDSLEEIYYLDVPGNWESYGDGTQINRYQIGFWDTFWAQEGKSGRMHLQQSVATDYALGNHCVDTLPKLDEADGVTVQAVEFAGLHGVKVTVPQGLSRKDAQYCPDGETRIYWTDGAYMMKFVYPRWVSDDDAEAILKTLHKERYIQAIPEDYGIVNVEKLRELKPGLDLDAGNGTSIANIVMGQGMFAYGNGRIYYGGVGRIYSIDPANGGVEELVLANPYSHPYYLFTTEDYVGYVPEYDTLEVLALDGSGEKQIYQGIGSTNLYADGMQLYSDGGKEMLSRIDLNTGEITDLLPDVNTYYVDGENIYATQTGQGHYFLRSGKEAVDFEKVPLSFYPIKVLADGEDLYFCEGGVGGTRQLIRYRDGEETRLPIFAYDYQILDGHLIYRDEGNRKLLKSYDLATGDTKVLCDTLFDFGILEGRYICSLCFGGDVEIFDWQTGEIQIVDIDE